MQGEEESIRHLMRCPSNADLTESALGKVMQLLGLEKAEGQGDEAQSCSYGIKDPQREDADNVMKEWGWTQGQGKMMTTGKGDTKVHKGTVHRLMRAWKRKREEEQQKAHELSPEPLDYITYDTLMVSPRGEEVPLDRNVRSDREVGDFLALTGCLEDRGKIILWIAEIKEVIMEKPRGYRVSYYTQKETNGTLWLPEKDRELERIGDNSAIIGKVRLADRLFLELKVLYVTGDPDFIHYSSSGNIRFCLG